jgi:hypothetical protein
MPRSTRHGFDVVLRQAVDEAQTDTDCQYGPMLSKLVNIPSRLRRPSASRTAVEVLSVLVDKAQDREVTTVGWVSSGSGKVGVGERGPA